MRSKNGSWAKDAEVLSTTAPNARIKIRMVVSPENS
jgi:hypothetical protein